MSNKGTFCAYYNMNNLTIGDIVMADLEERVILLEQQVSAIKDLLSIIIETYNPESNQIQFQNDLQQTSKNSFPKSVGDV